LIEVQEDITRFQVAVDKALCVQVVQSIGDRGCAAQRVLGAKFPRLEPINERSAAEVWGGEITDIPRQAIIIDW
jgi:hypothetical protein